MHALQEYKHAATADVLAFHDGELSLRQRRNMAREFSNLEYVLLDEQLWSMPVDYLLHQRFFKRRYTDELGPRDTVRWLGVRFWTRTLFAFVAQRGYTWVMRVGRGARMRTPIAVNLFDQAANAGVWYAYRLAGCEPVQRADFFRLVQRYVLQHGVRPMWLSGCANSSIVHFNRVSCGATLQGAIQADFFVANVSFWTTPAVQHFLEHAVDLSGAIWRFNWHEGLWHTAVVRLFAPRWRVAHLRSWTHETGAPKQPRPAADEPFSNTAYLDIGTDDPEGPIRLRKWQARGRRHKVWGEQCAPVNHRSDHPTSSARQASKVLQ